MMQAVIFQHETHEGPGLLAPLLTAAGFTLTPRMRAVHHHEDASADLLVVMGGTMGVYDTQAHPFLGQELAVAAERLAAGRPVLGICLGAQLLAAAAGSEVAPGRNGLELGVAPVRWSAAALGDAVLQGVSARNPVAHWHQDTYSAVPGGVLLASTDRYAQQAFRLGNSYGFQFHLELTAATFDGWLQDAADSLQARGQDVNRLRRDVGKLRAAEAGNTALLERLVHHFAQAARGAR